MIMHVQFTIKIGDIYTHPINLLSLSKITEVVDSQDVTTFRINGFEVYETEYNRIIALMTTNGCLQ